MNSRGAYDEDEMLRRAIEESKEMGTLKRSRDDDGEYVESTEIQGFELTEKAATK